MTYHLEVKVNGKTLFTRGPYKTLKAAEAEKEYLLTLNDSADIQIFRKETAKPRRKESNGI
jgi:hypothetical protein